jgi:hypothetical protein
VSATTDGPSRREWALAAAVLGAAQLLLFGRVLLLDAALHGRDVLHHYWPLHEAVRRALTEGRLPAWDPTVQGGIPLLANLHAGVFYPPNLLYLALDFPRAYAWLTALHLGFFGLGMWALLRRWYPLAPALGGALALSLSGPAISLNVYGPFLSSLAWLPWALWALLSTWRWDARAAAFGGFVALQVLGGDPMPALFTALLAGLGLGVLRPGRPALWGLLAGGVLAALLSAVQLWPSVELLLYSARGAGLRDAWSLHPARLLELGAPSLFGHYLQEPAFWGNFLSNGPVKIPFLLSAYLGASALTLALAGWRRTRQVGFACAAIAVGLVLALGARFVAGPLLAHVPPFAFFRYPEKYLLLAAFGLAVLVASALEALGGKARARWLGLLPSAVALLGILLGGPLARLLEPLLGSTLARPGARFPFEMVTASVAASSSLALAIGLTTFGALAARRWVDPARAGWLVIGLVVADLVAAGTPAVWTGPIALYRERPPLLDALPALSAQRPSRIFRDNGRLERGVQSEGTYEGMAERRAFDVLTLKSSIATVWGLEDLGSASPVAIERWAALVRALGNQQARAFALYNVCAAIAPAQGPLAADPAFALRAQVERGVGLFAVPSCLPRLRFVSRARSVAGPDEALQLLARPDFDAAAEAVVEGGAASLGDGARVVEARFAPSGAVEATVDAPQGGLLVYAMSWFPGWSARIDGVPAAPRVVDGALVGLEVPAGARQIAIEFAPRHLRWAVGASVLGVVVFLTLGVRRLLSRLVHQR